MTLEDAGEDQMHSEFGVQICPPQPLLKSCIHHDTFSTVLGPPPREDPAVALSGDQKRNRRNLIKMVYPSGIAAGDLGLLLFSAARQNLLNDLPAPGEGGFDMGII